MVSPPRTENDRPYKAEPTSNRLHEIDSAINICKKLIAAFEQQYPDLHLSFGLIAAPLDSTVDAEELINRADKKMYQAKEHKGSYIMR